MGFDDIQINFICKHCNSKNFIIKNLSLKCETCGLYISNKNKLNNNINERNKNKKIHLNNVLNKMGAVDEDSIQNLYDNLINKITIEGISIDHIDSTYICEFLKKKNKKSYITNLSLLNKFKNVDFTLSNLDKKYIKIIFNEFLKNNNMTSISYHSILYKIIKILNIKIHCKPSLTKINNEDFNKKFDNFLNNLCEKYTNITLDKNNLSLHCKPEINNHLNLIKDNDIFI